SSAVPILVRPSAFSAGSRACHSKKGCAPRSNISGRLSSPKRPRLAAKEVLPRCLGGVARGLMLDIPTLGGGCDKTLLDRPSVRFDRCRSGGSSSSLWFFNWNGPRPWWRGRAQRRRHCAEHWHGAGTHFAD